MNKNLVGAIAMAAAGVLGLACDDDDDDEISAGRAGFVTFDLDGNGVITTTEWDTVVDAWDVNGDGFVSENEFLLDDGFDDLDIDDDDLLTDAEIEAAVGTWDLNGDGLLDAAELDPFI
jgi:hypothetical protein